MTWDIEALLPIREEGVLRICIALKNPSPRSGSNPRPLGPVASTLITKHTKAAQHTLLFIRCVDKLSHTILVVVQDFWVLEMMRHQVITQWRTRWQHWGGCDRTSNTSAVTQKELLFKARVRGASRRTFICSRPPAEVSTLYLSATTRAVCT
jgi:hypothetical protein